MGESITQLTNDTLVAVGGDGGNQPNSCKGFLGGAWVIAVTSGGDDVFQKLYSDCANAAQWANYVRSTADGGFLLSGGDSSTPFCQPCAWLAKFNSSGTIVWQEDLVSFGLSGVNPKPTSDGGYITAGFALPSETGPLGGLIMKLSAPGAARWSELFTETAQSFPGAIINTSIGFQFDSIVPTPDGGYVLAGVADAKFASGFAHVLVLMKITSGREVQWLRAYYSDIWGSDAPGGSLKYPVFPTADGGYTVSGTVRMLAEPFQTLFLLMQVGLHPRGLDQHLLTGMGRVVGQNRRRGKHPMAESVPRYGTDRIERRRASGRHSDGRRRLCCSRSVVCGKPELRRPGILHPEDRSTGKGRLLHVVLTGDAGHCTGVGSASV